MVGFIVLCQNVWEANEMVQFLTVSNKTSDTFPTANAGVPGIPVGLRSQPAQLCALGHWHGCPYSSLVTVLVYQ